MDSADAREEVHDAATVPAGVFVGVLDPERSVSGLAIRMLGLLWREQEMVRWCVILAAMLGFCFSGWPLELSGESVFGEGRLAWLWFVFSACGVGIALYVVAEGVSRGLRGVLGLAAERGATAGSGADWAARAAVRVLSGRALPWASGPGVWIFGPPWEKEEMAVSSRAAALCASAATRSASGEVERVTRPMNPKDVARALVTMLPWAAYWASSSQLASLSLLIAGVFFALLLQAARGAGLLGLGGVWISPEGCRRSWFDRSRVMRPRESALVVVVRDWGKPAAEVAVADQEGSMRFQAAGPALLHVVAVWMARGRRSG